MVPKVKGQDRECPGVIGTNDRKCKLGGYPTAKAGSFRGGFLLHVPPDIDMKAHGTPCYAG